MSDHSFCSSRIQGSGLRSTVICLWCRIHQLTICRGTYCLLVVATLLDLLTPELLHNVDKFIASCQTYEGGFACSTYTFPSTSASMAEAHGGYTSCALLAHFLLSCVKPAKNVSTSSKVETEPQPEPEIEESSLDPNFPQSIDINAALRWSVLMQGESIEAGGFRGRSNKLVDGCYSWWVGGGFPILEELIRRESGMDMGGVELYNRREPMMGFEDVMS